MAAKLRVHNLAKELGVDSKAIVSKCQAEGLDVPNHMHVVTAGLEATIREWFSVGPHSTAVEQAAPVDLVKARKARTPRKSKAKSKSGGDESPDDGNESSSDTATAVADLPESELESTEAASTEIETTTTMAPEFPHQEPIQADELAPTDEGDDDVEAEAEEAPAAGRLAASADDDADADAGVDVEPPPVKPGPQNVPEPARLTGPRVVRMEAPDDIAPPRRSFRPPPRPPGSGEGPRSLPTDDERGRAAARRPGPGPGRAPDRDSPAADGPAAGRRSPRRTVRDTQVLASEHLREWRDRDLIERRERLDHATGRGIGGLRAVEGKQTRRSTGGARQTFERSRKDRIELTEPVVIKDFSREAGITVADILRKLLQDHNVMATPAGNLDNDMAQLIASEFGIELEIHERKTGLDVVAEEFALIERKHPETRPPVVTVLGHVDHGKTSLLDRIRKTKVAAGEAGGITQHIGAYRVRVGDRFVTFLDTPGHTAFTAMRARGANMTDVVVLVVAADDGVMPTTVEAIHHAKAANATVVVALNKIDLPHDINRIYAQLSEHGLTPSGDWGGETDVIKTSATTGQGIDELLGHLATLSDVLDLTADPSIPATGTVIEAQRKEDVGNIVRLLVQEGTLKPGQVVVCGTAHGKVRLLRNDQGKSINKAGPSTPVEVLGLSDVPAAGDRFFVLSSAQRAKEIAEEAAQQRRMDSLAKSAKPTTLESVLAARAGGLTPELRVIVKGDVQGSIDVLENELMKFPQDRVKLNILHDGVGTITESDVVLAQASDAIIIGFHVVPDPAITRMADEARVSIRTYRVIYNLIDDIRKALEEQLPPEEHIESRGRAEVREVFTITRVGKIAGCIVRDGVIARNHMVRVLRNDVLLRDNCAIDSLRRFKDDAREVRAGLECGIKIARFDDLKPGDVIESYEVVKVAQKLE